MDLRGEESQTAGRTHVEVIVAAYVSYVFKFLIDVKSIEVSNKKPRDVF
jgi:hypothetical protein